MDGAEDVDLVLRLSEKGKILNLNQVLLDYRIHTTQESFRMRARHTAVQELAFRLALSRRKKHHDPLEIDPELAEKFIQWRLSTPGYVRSRTFLTALRYMGTYLRGLDLKGFAHCFLVALGSLPVLPAIDLHQLARFSQSRSGLAGRTHAFCIPQSELTRPRICAYSFSPSVSTWARICSTTASVDSANCLWNSHGSVMKSKESR